MKKTIIGTVSGFIAGGIAGMAIERRRAKARKEIKAIKVNPDPDNAVRKQLDEIGSLINENLSNLAEGLNGSSEENGKIVKFRR